MATRREYLHECAMRGYFALKAAFLRLGLQPAAGLPPAFDLVLMNYLRRCGHTWHPGRARAPVNSRVSRLAGEALCEVAGLIKSIARA